MHPYLIPAVVLALTVCFGASSAWAAEPAKFQIGEITVWSVADAAGERDLSAFLADRETVEKYVPSGRSMSGVVALVVRSGKEVVLIDTGYGRDVSLLLSGLAAVGLEPSDITTVLITHMHGDHVGGLVRNGARAFPGARLLIGREEHAFWLDEGSRAAFPGRAANFDKAVEVVGLYEGDVGLFEFGASVAPGVTALEAVGHTPGHTAFMIESGGQRLLCVADLLHDSVLQFARPDINATYDMLPEAARATRERILKLAADENIPIAGMHLPFPAVGRVRAAAGGYVYQTGLE